MYIRIGRRIINTEALTDVEEYAPEAEARTLVVTFIGGRSLTLEAKDADAFLEALPVYTPVPDPPTEKEHQSAAWMDGYRDGREAEPYDSGYVDPDQCIEEEKAEYLRAYEAGAAQAGREE